MDSALSRQWSAQWSAPAMLPAPSPLSVSYALKARAAGAQLAAASEAAAAAAAAAAARKAPRLPALGAAPLKTSQPLRASPLKVVSAPPAGPPESSDDSVLPPMRVLKRFEEWILPRSFNDQENLGMGKCVWARGCARARMSRSEGCKRTISSALSTHVPRSLSPLLSTQHVVSVLPAPHCHHLHRRGLVEHPQHCRQLDG